ncbi:DUF21 domain-containing protein [Haloarcula halophila]|uniref:DUF21 domain-containing protein n=1 Tax=Haloarcula TaxID=2237 RepID=UPI0023E3B61F|nr:DUF21 domain-containing protein [Halomicroarcula sp. DFY41]
MDTSTLSSLGTIVVLLAASAFFSSSETALFTVSRESLTAAAESDPRGAAALEVLADPHRLLVTILVGNNVVNIAISSLLTALLVDHVQSSVAVLVTTVVASSVILVAGEIVPKSYGLGHANSYALRVVRPLRYVELLLYPAVVAFDLLTRQITRRIGGQPDIERPYEDEE